MWAIGRKLRCDGRTPMCINCSQMKKICEYAAEPRRRGKGRKPRKTRRRASDQKVDEASDRTSFDIGVDNSCFVESEHLIDVLCTTVAMYRVG